MGNHDFTETGDQSSEPDKSLDRIDELLRAGLLAPPVRPPFRAARDHYDIANCIDDGGSGVVLLARDSKSDALVALKMLKPQFHREAAFKAALIAEGKLMRQILLVHPNILSVIEVNELVPYFTMPFMAGGNLTGRIRQSWPFPLDNAIRITRQIAEALCFAHQRRVLHRDLKPANILFDTAGLARVSDFGLAHNFDAKSHSNLRIGNLVGTLPYLSPGTLQGNFEDTRGDIYSFGAVLYEMLAGRPPYTGATSEEIIQKVLTGPPVPIEKSNSHAPHRLIVVTRGAMEREIGNRYPTMAHVLADLERVANGKNPRGPLPQKLGKKVVIVLSIIAAIIGTVIGGVGAFMLIVGPAEGNTSSGLDIQSQFTQGGLSSTNYSDSNGWNIRKFTLDGVSQCSAVKLGDWDGDNHLDLFMATGRTCVVFLNNGQLARMITVTNSPTPLKVSLVTDAVRQGASTVFLHWSDNRQLHLAGVNLSGKFMDCIGAASPRKHPSKGTYYAGLQAVGDLDLERNGRVGFYALAGAGYALQPRGLYRFDAGTERLLWRRLIAAEPTSITTVQWEEPRPAAIVMGTAAVWNGATLDGISDKHCYLHAFSAKGERLWKAEVGDENGDEYVHSHPFVLPVKQDDPGADGLVRHRLYCWTSTSGELRPDKGPVGRILALDADGNLIGTNNFGIQIHSCRVEDVDNDGELEILASCSDGRLRVLRSDLSELHNIPIVPIRKTRVVLELVAFTNILDRSSRHYIFKSSQEYVGPGRNPGSTGEVNIRHYHDNRILIVDTLFRVVHSFLVEPKWTEHPGWTVSVADWDGDGNLEIISMAREILILNCPKP